MGILSSFPHSADLLFEDDIALRAICHTEEEEAFDIDANAASSLAFGLAQRLHALSMQYGAPAQAARLSACVVAMVCQAVLQGHVCMPLSICASRLGVDGEVLRAALLHSKIVAQDGEGSSVLLPVVLDAGDRVYLARYYDYEQRLAQGLSALCQAYPLEKISEGVLRTEAASAAQSTTAPTQSVLAWEERINRHSDLLGLAEHQRLAVALTVLNRFTIISGGPGTGKTTTTLGVLACLIEGSPSLRIALAAPTGRAAQHLFHALGQQASRLPMELAVRLPQKAFTVHRLLGERTVHATAYADTYDARSQNSIVDKNVDQLPYDLIVVDEASMLDLALATQLIEALPAHAKLVLLGDKYQLGAIEGGALFAELTATSRFTTDYLDILKLLLPKHATLLDGLASPSIESEKAPLSQATSCASQQLHFNFESTVEVSSPSMPPKQEIRIAETKPADALVNCCVELEQNYRFPKDSPIGRLAQAIREADFLTARSVLSNSTLNAQEGGKPAQEEKKKRQSLSWITTDLPPGGASPKQEGGALTQATLQRLAEGFTPYFNALQKVLFHSAISPKRDAVDPPLEALRAALNTYRVLCPVYQGPYGVQALNTQLNRLFHTQLFNALQEQLASDVGALELQEIAAVLEAERHSWSNAFSYSAVSHQPMTLYPGLPLMVTRNHYGLDLFNGDIGIVLPCSVIQRIVPSTVDVPIKEGEGALGVLFCKPDQHVKVVLPALLPSWRSAFAMTVHKAQGSEFDHMALVLPHLANHRQTYPMTRAMLYTAITRARQQITLVGCEQALEAAIHTDTPLYSGLQARLAAFSKSRKMAI